jgi:hypothetical protein
MEVQNGIDSRVSRAICYLITDGNLKRNLPNFSLDSRRTKAAMTNLGCQYIQIYVGYIT